jgi:hypothetical protein
MTTDTAQISGAPEAAPEMAPPRVRMDRSRTFSTIHGDRPPGDPHHGVAYRQDGIPCDGEGYFLFDHPDMKKPGKDGDHARKMAQKHIARALKAEASKPKRVAPPPRDDSDEFDTDADGRPIHSAEADDDEEDDDLLPPVNLSEWLRGGQEVVWTDVGQEIARAYKKRIASIKDAVAFLVNDEKLVPKDQLRPSFKKFAA